MPDVLRLQWRGYYRAISKRELPPSGLLYSIEVLADQTSKAPSITELGCTSFLRGRHYQTLGWGGMVRFLEPLSHFITTHASLPIS